MGISSRIRVIGIFAIILFLISTLVYSNPDIAETHLPTKVSDSLRKLQDGVASFSNPLTQDAPPESSLSEEILTSGKEDEFEIVADSGDQLIGEEDVSTVSNNEPTPTVGTHADIFSMAKAFEAAAKAAEPTADTTHEAPLNDEPEDDKFKVSQNAGTVSHMVEETSKIEDAGPELTAEEKKQKEERDKKEKERLFDIRKDKLIRDHEYQRDETIKEMAKNATLRNSFKVTTDDIGIILRTGSQIEGRLLGPVSTWAMNRTAENMVIFSDQPSRFMNYIVQDAIAPWADRPKIAGTEAVKYWRKLSEATKHNQKREFSGWQLDALKFVSSVHLGYNQLRKHQDFKWYAFVDDDTYYHLPTLAALLSNLDYTDEFYTGGVSYFGIAFAHGGSGSIASAGAMKKRFVDNADTVVEYHDIGATAQYGDTNLARAFEAVDIWFDHSFRDSFNGDGPYHKPMGRDLLCQHAVTFHHLPVDFFPIYHEAVKDYDVLTYLDVATALAHLDKKASALTDLWVKKDWTFNLHIEDTFTAAEAKDHRNDVWTYTVDQRHSDKMSSEKCQGTCQAEDNCIAWTYLPAEHTCAMSDWFRLGHQRNGVRSGINPLKLAQWSANCEPQWPKNFS